jgi:hypothetical protein
MDDLSAKINRCKDCIFSMPSSEDRYVWCNVHEYFIDKNESCNFWNMKQSLQTYQNKG